MSVEQPETVVPTSAPTSPEVGTAVPPQAAAPTEEAYFPGEVVRSTPSRTEDERLDPQPVLLLLEDSEIPFDLQPLKLRQFLRLLRIVTRGASDVMDAGSLNFDDVDTFAQTFAGMVLFSIPEAEEEAIEFVKSIVKPAALTGDAKIDGPKWEALYAELDNPELEDFVTIIQALVEREAEDLRALGKRLMKMFETATKMGATGKNAAVSPA